MVVIAHIQKAITVIAKNSIRIEKRRIDIAAFEVIDPENTPLRV